MTMMICRSKFVRDGGADEWVGYVGHHHQGQGDPDGAQRRTKGQHHRLSTCLSQILYKYCETAILVLMSHCVKFIFCHRRPNRHLNLCTSLLNSKGDWWLGPKAHLSFNVELSNFVFLSPCLRVSCSDLLIHISLLIRKLAQMENLNCKIFSPKNVKRPVRISNK